MAQIEERCNYALDRYEDLEEKIPAKKKRIRADYSAIKKAAADFDKAGWDSSVVMLERQKFERKLSKFEDDLGEIESVLKSTKDKDEDEDDQSDLEIIEEVIKVHQKLNFNFIRQKPASFFRIKDITKIDRISNQTYIEPVLEFQGGNELGGAYPDYLPTQKHVYWYKRLLGDVDIKLQIYDHSTKSLATVTVPALKKSYNFIMNTMDTIEELDDHRVFNTVDTKPLITPEVKDDKIECPWIFRCLGESMGSGKEENIRYFHKYVYTLCWGDPGNPMTPLLVFYGKGRGGKGFTYERLLPLLLPKSRIMVGMYGLLSGNFNKFELGKTAMLIDEVPPMNAWNLIKNWTGSRSGVVNMKYGAMIEIDNTIARAVASNSEVYPLPYEEGKQMDRVSPMKMERNFTFGEVIYRNWAEEFDTMEIEDFLKSILGCETLPISRETYSNDSDYHFKIGDMMLKNCPELYEDPSTVQQYANWLHQEFNAKEGRFFLEPLRGSDWDEIISNKVDCSIKIAEAMIENGEDYIFVDDIMEVYNVLYSEGKKEKKFQNSKAKVKELIGPLLEDAGYEFHEKKRLYRDKTIGEKAKDSRRTEVVSQTYGWIKNPQRKYTTIADKYLSEVKTATGNVIMADLYHSADGIDDLLDSLDKSV